MSIFKRKAQKSETLTLNQLLDFLGIASTDTSHLSEATYFACLKVLSESIGKLPLKLLQSTPSKGIKEAYQASALQCVADQAEPLHDIDRLLVDRGIQPEPLRKRLLPDHWCCKRLEAMDFTK